MKVSEVSLETPIPISWTINYAMLGWVVWRLKNSHFWC